MIEPAVEHDGEGVVIRIPMQLKTRRGRKEVVVPEGLPGARRSKPEAREPLRTALARAFHWQERIESGRFSGVTDLAAALGLDRSYVGRILRLAALAPTVVEAIVEGREPGGMSLERLVKGTPLVWAEQGATDAAGAGDRGH